ncbi:MAG: hypothetical protein AAFO17_17430, partial [Pseudomonadota bacterium]
VTGLRQRRVPLIQIEETTLIGHRPPPCCPRDGITIILSKRGVFQGVRSVRTNDFLIALVQGIAQGAAAPLCPTTVGRRRAVSYTAYLARYLIQCVTLQRVMSYI